MNSVKTTKAAVLREINSPLSVEELRLQNLGYGQLLVRILFSGICRSQLMEQQGFRGEDKWLPHFLGHEGFGIVLAVGDGVTKCVPGDRVVLSWVKGKGIDAENPKYISQDGTEVNAGKVTTFSTHAIVSENRTFHAPEGFDDRFLSLFGCALLTGGGMGIKYGSEVSDGVIGILGFGGIGMAAALVLKGMSKKNIMIIERSEEKRNLAISLGFSRVLNSIDETDSKFDLIIEAAGSIESIQSGFASLTDTGTLVFASHPETGAKISIDPHELIKGKKIFGTWGGDVQPDEDMHIIGKYLKESGANLNLLLGEEFTIDDINDGLAYLDSGKPGRPLLTMNED